MKRVVVLILLLIIAGFIYQNKSQIVGVDKNKLKTDILPKIIEKLVAPGTKFKVEDLKEANGVYEVSLTLGEGQNSQKLASYITKDGKIFFTSGIKVADLNKPIPTPKQQVKGAVDKKVCESLPKSEKPVLTVFIVSKCPYGLQMQRVLKKAIGELPQVADNLTVRYIGSVENGKITSMHGDEEAQENLKQICIREEQKNKYWPYVSCYMQAGKSDECLLTANVNADQLNTCLSDNKKGLTYAQKDFDLANKYGVTGSPTLLINNQVVSESDFGGRNPNAIKEIVGCSFKTRPDVFKKDLTKTDVAASFSQTDESTQTAGSSASCATQ